MLTVITPSGSKLLTTAARVRDEIPTITEAVASDAKLARWIERASGMVVEYCGRDFAQEGVSETLFPCGVSQVLFARTPIADLVVTLDGTALTAGTDYHHDRRVQALCRLDANGRPCPWSGKLVLAYNAGYVVPDGAPIGATSMPLPGDVEYAVQLLVASFVGMQASATASANIKRESVLNGLIDITYADSSGSETAQALPPRVSELLEPYRVPSL